MSPLPMDAPPEQAFLPPTLPEPAGEAGAVFQSLACACFFLYALAVLLAVLPPQLLMPEWQIRFGQMLIGQAPLALLGVGLAHLAGYLDPDATRLQRRLMTLRRWTVAVTVAFLMLLPLQWQAFASTLRQESRSLDQQRQQLHRRHDQLRQAIRSAADQDQLAQTLQRFQAPGLPASARRLPLRKLQQQLLRVEAVAHRGVRRQLEAEANQRLSSSLRSAIGLMLSTLVLALSFAACSQRRRSPYSLLQEGLLLIKATGTASPGPGPGWRHGYVERDYFESLSAEPWPADDNSAIGTECSNTTGTEEPCRRNAAFMPAARLPEHLEAP